MLRDLFVYSAINDWDEAVFYPTPLGYAALILFGLAVLVLALHFGGKRLQKKMSVRQLVFSAAAMALALVTAEIHLFRMPLGGSVTLCSMLFIALIGYWYGPEAGLLTGAAHGILQLIMNPMIYSLPQMLLDYPLAFAMLGLSGVFRDRKGGLIKGYLLGVLGRMFCSFLSGFLFFADYAPEAMNPVWYSALYQLSYMGPEAAITVLLLLLPPMKKALAAVKTMALGDVSGS